MLDSKLLKENPEIIIEMLKKRRSNYPINDLIDADKRRRDLIIKLQNARHEKNKMASSIAIKKKNNHEITDEITIMNEIGSSIDILEKEIKINSEIFDNLIKRIPNILDRSVPEGNDELDNIVIKEHKNTTTKNSSSNFGLNPKDHVTIGSSLDLMDLERAAKISGARFYFLKNELVRLNQALINFALDYLADKGYILTQPPYMIRKSAMEGAIILDDFEHVIYKIDNEDLFMIGTSEHAIASMHMDEILCGKDLPIRYAGLSPCFRKEAGAHGKDMKGIFRVHHFDKIEQFVYSHPERSFEEHERMLQITEEFYQQLDIPYRIVLLCSADTGNISAKTYDIEAWMPAQNAFREIVSCSNCTDYQARRLRIRYREKTNEETRLVHTLNSTLVATERTLVAILENYQTDDGSIIIPNVLQKYMGDTKKISNSNNIIS